MGPNEYQLDDEVLDRRNNTSYYASDSDDSGWDEPIDWALRDVERAAETARKFQRRVRIIQLLGSALSTSFPEDTIFIAYATSTLLQTIPDMENFGTF